MEGDGRAKRDLGSGTHSSNSNCKGEIALFDKELLKFLQERLQKEREEQSEISAPSAVRKKFEVLSAKEQVQRALLRSGKPDAKETPFVKS